VNLLDIKSKRDNGFKSNSAIISVIPKKRYKISTEYVGINGDPYSAYFGVIILDEKGIELDRKIRWLNDFSGEKKQENIVINISTNRIFIIYRINAEMTQKSDCHYQLLPFEKISVTQVNSDMEEDYDSINDIPLPRLNELSEEQELTIEKNMVWLCSIGRSGSTWLGSQLLSYNTHYIHEPDITSHLGVTRGDIGKRVRIKDVRKDRDYFLSSAYKNTWKFYLRKLIINRIYAQVGDFSKKIILKESTRFDGSDIICECLPNSKMIILFRDGRDVTDSRLDARLEGGWVAQELGHSSYEKGREDFISISSWDWVLVTENLLKTARIFGKEFVYQVKYEDLLRNTCGELEKIYQFLKIDISKDELGKIIEKYSFKNISSENKGKSKFFRSATPGKWKENFTDEEKKIMNKIMGNLLKKLGYE